MHIVDIIKAVFYSIFFCFVVEGQLFAEGFLHGTQVKIPSGYVAIEQLQVHDLVMCCDNEWSFTERPITTLHKKRVARYIKITVGNEFIYAAVDQKFYIQKKQMWIEACAIVPGDVLLSNRSILITVDDVITMDGQVTLYDITVDSYHNFCVSLRDIHVHNALPVIAALGWIAGLGALEVTKATLAVTGTVIAFVVLRNNDKQKTTINTSPGFGGQNNNHRSPEENDPDDKKQKRDETRKNHRPLTNKDARQKAQELGYREVKNHPCQNTRNRPVFINEKKNLYISPDIDGHNGGYWKMFKANGRRIGTWNLDLTKEIGK